LAAGSASLNEIAMASPLNKAYWSKTKITMRGVKLSGWSEKQIAEAIKKADERKAARPPKPAKPEEPS
jgi:hypothetical protein